MLKIQKHAELDRIDGWRAHLVHIADSMGQFHQSEHLADHLDSIIADLDARSNELVADGPIVTFTGGQSVDQQRRA